MMTGKSPTVWDAVCIDCKKTYRRRSTGIVRCWTCYWKNRPEAYELKKEYNRTHRKVHRKRVVEFGRRYE